MTGGQSARVTGRPGGVDARQVVAAVAWLLARVQAAPDPQADQTAAIVLVRAARQAARAAGGTR